MYLMEKSSLSAPWVKTPYASASSKNWVMAAGRANSCQRRLFVAVPVNGITPCSRATHAARINAKWPISTIMKHSFCYCSVLMDCAAFAAAASSNAC